MFTKGKLQDTSILGAPQIIVNYGQKL